MGLVKEEQFVGFLRDVSNVEFDPDAFDEVISASFAETGNGASDVVAEYIKNNQDDVRGLGESLTDIVKTFCEEFSENERLVGKSVRAINACYSFLPIKTLYYAARKFYNYAVNKISKAVNRCVKHIRDNEVLEEFNSEGFERNFPETFRKIENLISSVDEDAFDSGLQALIDQLEEMEEFSQVKKSSVH